MRIRLLLLAVAALMLTGCASHTRETQLQQTLSAYGQTIRWGDIASAVQFMEPEQRRNKPPSELQLERYKQIRVSSYDASGPVPVSENEVHQRATIGIINRHTMRQRSIIDNQVWVYDPVEQNWWLKSGLPDITH